MTSNVVDANIIRAYFEEAVLNLTPDTTAPCRAFIESLGSTNVCFVDSNGTIEHEWGNVVDPDWFRAWFGDLLATGAVGIIDAPARPDLRNELRKLGFPANGRDIWYVRAAAAAAGNADSAQLVTEDIDFFDPTKKKAGKKARDRLLHERKGPVLKALEKHGISVNAMCTCII
ncbi:MAG TPA: hypothetical protein VFU06_01095 [Longimicrobiales bacterium]|nr:hypothetical protein [Longimicrobiales bacterium]